jgi:hypothetical protein
MKYISFIFILFLFSCNLNSRKTDGDVTIEYKNGIKADSIYKFPHSNIKRVTIFDTKGDVLEAGSYYKSERASFWKKYSQNKVVEVTNYNEDPPLKIENIEDFSFRRYNIDNSVSILVPEKWKSIKCSDSFTVCQKKSNDTANINLPFFVVQVFKNVDSINQRNYQDSFADSLIGNSLNYEVEDEVNYQSGAVSTLYNIKFKENSIFLIRHLAIIDGNLYIFDNVSVIDKNRDCLLYNDIFMDIIFSIQKNNASIYTR